LKPAEAAENTARKEVMMVKKVPKCPRSKSLLFFSSKCSHKMDFKLFFGDLKCLAGKMVGSISGSHGEKRHFESQRNIWGQFNSFLQFSNLGATFGASSIRFYGLVAASNWKVAASIPLQNCYVYFEH
jgi:hypothetical protein